VRLQARQRGNGDRLHIGVLDQRAPIAVALEYACFARYRGRVRGIAAGERHDLAAQIRSEGRQLHGAPVIDAHNA
jgi:hypothetical protein